MSRRIAAVVAVALSMYLDTILFARVNLYGVRPNALLAVVVSYAILCGPIPGMLVGLIGGLLMDIFTGPAVGLSAALYVATGYLAGQFYQKFYADNPFVPAAVAAVAGVGKEMAMAIAALLMGRQFALGSMVLRYIVPGALYTGLLCMVLHVVWKKLFTRQVNKHATLP